MKLDTTKCRNAKPAERAYRLADGNGLSLLVTPTGSKLWQWFHRIEGKAKTASLGPFPEVGLKDARDAVLRERAKQRSPDEQPTVAVKTFAAVAKEHFDVWRVNKVPNHTQRVWADWNRTPCLKSVTRRSTRSNPPTWWR